MAATVTRRRMLEAAARAGGSVAVGRVAVDDEGYVVWPDPDPLAVNICPGCGSAICTPSTCPA